MDKIKILITGPVNGSIQDLHQKLSALQKSKAGPFEMCFCVGPFFGSPDKEQETKSLLEEKSIVMPLPVYFCDVGVLPKDIKLPSFEICSVDDDAEISIENADEDNQTEQSDSLSKGIIQVAENLYHLHGISTSQDSQSADICNIPSTSEPKNYLTVAFIPPNSRLGTIDTAKLESKTNHPSYVGCDLLLTSEWGQGMASITSSCLTNAERTKLGLKLASDTDGTNTGNEIGSYDIAEIASQCRPRYHIAPSLSQPDPSKDGAATSFFIQSLPYINPPSAMASGVMKNYHTSRFLALCPVVDAATQKENGKAKKFIHALGVQPLWSMDRETATTVPENTAVAPSPYTDETYDKDNFQSNGKVNTVNMNIGLSEAQTRRILNEDSGSQDYRWNIRNKKRSLEESQNDAALDPSNCSLFLHGLHNDVTGGVTLSRDNLLKAFEGRGCVQVRFPSKTGAPSYCFLDFASHDQAKTCLELSGGQEMVMGIPLTLKWSSGGRRMGGNVPPPPPAGHVGVYNGSQSMKRARLTENEAADSSSLFVHLATIEDDGNNTFDFIAKLAQDKLEDAINADGGEERVTAETEPALKVSCRQLKGKQNCGFLDFASHAAASMALATLTGSTDGGTLQYEGENKDITDMLDKLGEVQLWWAKNKETTDEDGDSNGLQLRSRHFPPDARTDCWFCLASPTCEKHLIVSISDHCYITMPKGPVNEHHALIVPVNHSAKEDGNMRSIIGAFVDPTAGAVSDLELSKNKLRKFANEELDCDLFVFERAIPTRGGYHAHVNCIPIKKGLGKEIMKTMLSQAATTNGGSGFELRELQNPDISVSSILHNAEDELTGYFYVEVPFGNDGEIKRYLYTALDQGNDARKHVPLQFGREVLAAVLGDDTLAHWKGCVKDAETETKLTETFRQAFSKYE